MVNKSGNIRTLAPPAPSLPGNICLEAENQLFTFHLILFSSTSIEIFLMLKNHAALLSDDNFVPRSPCYMDVGLDINFEASL